MDVLDCIVDVFHATWLFGLRGFPVVDHDDNAVACQCTSLAFTPFMIVSSRVEDNSSTMVPHNAGIVF